MKLACYVAAIFHRSYACRLTARSLMIAYTLWASGIEIQAATVTFGFVAEVTEITPSADIDFSPPSEIAVGAKLSGSLLFEPPLVFGSSSDGATLRLSKDSFSFVAEQRRLITENDSGGIGGGNGIIWDRALVQCGTTADCTSPIPVASGLEIRGLSLALVGDPEAIDPFVDFPANPETWNQLSLRRLFLLFGSPSATGSMTVIAEVGQFQLLPEPSAFPLSILTGMFVLSALRDLHRH